MDDQLIERLKALYPTRDTTGFNYFDLLHAEGSPLQALFYGRLFWPEFVEYDGMVFLRETVEDDTDERRIQEALVRYDHDRKRVEQSFNVVEVPSLFGRKMAESTDDDDRALASMLAVTWHQRLVTQYPGRAFDVRVLSPEESGGEIAIVFHTR
jgi:hypothetical protein